MSQIYFHVSTDFDKSIEVFSPRVPKMMTKGENNTIERICVAKTLEGCVKAHPLLTYYFSEDYRYTDIYNFLDLCHYAHDKDAFGVILKVYKFDATDLQILSNEHIVTNNYVPDAHLTGEEWILQPVKPIDYFYISLNTDEEDNWDIINCGKNLGTIENGLNYQLQKRHNDKYNYNEEKYEDYTLLVK